MPDVVLEAQFKADQAQLKEFNKRLKEGEGIVNQLDMRLKVLRASIKLASDPADIKRFTAELNATQAKLDAVNKAAGKSATGFNEFGRTLKGIKQELSLFLVGSFGGYSAALSLLEAGFKSLGDSIQHNLIYKTGISQDVIKDTVSFIRSETEKLKTEGLTDPEKTGLRLKEIEDNEKLLELDNKRVEINRQIYLLRLDIDPQMGMTEDQANKLRELSASAKEAASAYDQLKISIQGFDEKNIKGSLANLQRQQQHKQNQKEFSDWLEDLNKQFKSEQLVQIKAYNDEIERLKKLTITNRNAAIDAAIQRFQIGEDMKAGGFIKDPNSVSANVTGADIAQRKRRLAAFEKEQEEKFRIEKEGIDAREQYEEDSQRKIYNSQINFASNFTDLIGQASSQGFRNMEDLFKQTLQRMTAQMVSSGLLNLLKTIINPASAPTSFLGFLGFAEGGYTGRGGKYDPAGVVHKGEVVWNQEDVQRFGGVRAVESIRPTAGKQRSIGGNYFNGGEVVPLTQRQPIPEIIFRPTIKFDGYDIAYSLEMPNGGYEKLNKARGN